MKTSLYFVLSLFIFQSCALEEKVKEVSVDNKFSISIPSFLKEATDLNEDASLQFQSGLQEFYLIAIDEVKEEVHSIINENDLSEVYENSLKGYSKLIMEGFSDGLADVVQTEPIDTIINTIPARITQVSGTLEGLGIFYTIGTFEGKEDYIQIVTWTLAERKDRYNSKMNKILYSIKELSQGGSL